MANPRAMAVTGSPEVNASMTACTGEVSSIRKLNGVVARETPTPSAWLPLRREMRVVRHFGLLESLPADS